VLLTVADRQCGLRLPLDFARDDTGGVVLKNMPMLTALRFAKATSAIGAFIEGIDCSDATALSDNAAALRAALTEHGVLFVRDQSLTPAAQVRFAECFGTVAAVASTFATHPDDDRVELLESHGSGPGTDVWHADLTWLPEPPVATCFVCRRRSAVRRRYDVGEHDRGIRRARSGDAGALAQPVRAALMGVSGSDRSGAAW
jgi:hypothetical protein